MNPRTRFGLTALVALVFVFSIIASPPALGAPTYEVIVTVVGSGKVTLSPDKGGFYAKNNIVTLTATPATDWTFQGWGGALTGSANPATLRVAGPATITATFVPGSGGGGGGGGGTLPNALPKSKMIVGYFAQWAIYQRNYFIRNVETSGAAAAMNVMNYAFAAPDESLNCASLDTFADYNKAFNASESVDGVADVYSQPLKGNFNQILKLKKLHPNLRVLLSLGGWSQSQRFSEIASDAGKRQRFVKSCIDTFMRGNVAGVFDGFDVDWEYPGSCGLTCNFSTADRVNFPALLVEFRDQLERLEADAVTAGQPRPEYLLTIAAPAGQAHYGPIDIGAIHLTLDWINVMAYDFHGPWETIGPANHHASLYQSPCDPVTSDWGDKAIRAYRDAGVPSDKLLLGVPFYGHGWRGVAAVGSGLCQPATGIARGTYERGTDDFKVLDAKGRPEFSDSTTATHWSFNGSEFWSYDDTDSLAVKASYANTTQLRGVMFWELSGDRSDGLLVNKLRSSLGNP
jgi:chitinase